MMEYKGYTAKVEFDDEADIFHGEVIGIKDVVTFQGNTARELKKVFRESVDDYLSFCKERGEDPDKPFTGKFLVRISPELRTEKSACPRSFPMKALTHGSMRSWIALLMKT